MAVLLTGYESFGEFDTNPSEQIVEALDGTEVGGQRIVSAVLPVEFDEVDETLGRLLEEHDSETVLSTGLDDTIAAINVERVGINVRDSMTIPDNAGRTPHDEEVFHDGREAYMATIPVTEIVENLLAHDVPARLSNTAATHVCNNALYTTRYLVEERGLEVRSGFLHLPLTPAQAVAQARPNRPESGGDMPASLPLDLQREAVEIAIETAVRHSGSG